MKKQLETIVINKALATKVLAVVDQGLSEGLGESVLDTDTDTLIGVPGKMCVEAAVCYAIGQPFGDRPTCVEEKIREFKISVNDLDDVWGSNRARARSMRRLAIAQLGSAGKVSGKDFERAIWEAAFNKYVLPERLKQLEVFAAEFKFGGNPKLSGLNLNFNVSGGGWEAFGLFKSSSNFYDVSARTRVKRVDEFCEMAVQVLIKLKSPGTKYLYLTESATKPLKKVAKKAAKKRVRKA